MVVAMMVLALVAGAPGPGGMRVLAKGTHSGITRPVHEVVKSEEAWKKLWAEHTAGTEPAPALPAVDFKREMVVAALSGEQRTGGYGVEIVSVEAGPKVVTVLLRQTAPKPGGITIQALTQPFQFAAVPRSDLPVVFKLAPGDGAAVPLKQP